MVQEVIEDILKSGIRRKSLSFWRKNCLAKRRMGQLEKESDYFMSIDYSDMAFPKPKRRKENQPSRKHFEHRKGRVLSLCQSVWRLSAAVYGGNTMYCLDPGWEFYQAEGLKVYLCELHHKRGKEAVHNCRKTRELLCEIAQRNMKVTHTKDWMKISKKIIYWISKSWWKNRKMKSRKRTSRIPIFIASPAKCREDTTAGTSQNLS